VLPSAFALASALAFSGPTFAPVGELALGTYEPGSGPAPDLALHIGIGDPTGRPLAVGGAPRPRAIAGLPVCSGDVCQSAVSVPGFDPSYGSSRNARADAFAALLARARVEPLAAVGRALVVTGVRVDYSPSFFEPPGSGAHGWGNLAVRLRLRLDAQNAVVVPAVPR
jgi:hypothetical protein